MRVKKLLVEWLARRLPTCKEVTRLASDAMERKLPLRQWAAMKLHFMICAWCLRYFKQLHLMQEIARPHAESPPPSRLSSEARARLKQKLDSHS